MTNPGGNAGETSPSDSGTGPSEPSSGGYEAPPIEQYPPAQDSSGTPGYTPPPAYPPAGPPPSYPPPAFSPPGYPPPSYPPPTFPPPGAGPQGDYPPQYGAPPEGYGPPSGYPAPDYSAAYGAPSPKTNTMAIASLVSSLIGVLCGIGSIVGIVLGLVALNQIKTTREGGQGLAIAGIAVGGLSLLINLIWTVSVLSG